MQNNSKCRNLFNRRNGRNRKKSFANHLCFDIKEIFIVGHYDCGVALTSSKDILHNMRSRGVSEQQLKLIEKDFQVWLDPYTDPTKNVLTVIKKLKANPFIPNDIPIHGLIIDPHTGKLDLLADGYKEI